MLGPCGRDQFFQQVLQHDRMAAGLARGAIVAGGCHEPTLAESVHQRTHTEPICGMSRLSRGRDGRARNKCGQIQDEPRHCVVDLTRAADRPERFARRRCILRVRRSRRDRSERLDVAVSTAAGGGGGSGDPRM